MVLFAMVLSLVMGTAVVAGQLTPEEERRLAELQLQKARYLAKQIGRYQLFQGEYKFVNDKGQEFWEKALFKIDTATGQVWIGEQNTYKDRDDPTMMVQTRGWVDFLESLKFEGTGGKLESIGGTGGGEPLK